MTQISSGADTAAQPLDRSAAIELGPAPNDAAWHAAPADDVINQNRTRLSGLSAEEAASRLTAHGLNRLPAAKPPSVAVRFLAQFHHILIYVLLVAALVTAMLGHAVDTVVILLVVLANAIIGIIQEGRAEKALDAIRRMIMPRTSVLRDGRRITVDAENLVPGDIIVLEAGDRVTADVRLLRARNLKIDEAILTGESVAVEKNVEPVTVECALGDRRSMGFSGTLVVAGQGLGVVVATGINTQLGRISTLLGAVEKPTTPLVRQMNQFARHLTIAILGFSIAVFGFAVLFRAYVWPEAFMAVVSLAVAAIPEGLPAVLTITLAIGVQRMAARHAIIRRLPAVETLGSVSVICSDKTGTLTRNEMTVRTAVLCDHVIEVTGVGYEPHGAFRHRAQEVDPVAFPVLLQLSRAALLCNDATLRQTAGGWIVDGDPMEGALVAFAVKVGHDIDLLRKQYPRTDEIPFDAQHRFMATLHHGHDGSAVIYVKGAPERVLAMCQSQVGPRGPEALDRSRWLGQVDILGSEGQRVLALAMKPAPPGTRDLVFADVEDGMSLLGIVGLIDPPRDEAIDAVAECRTAGIQVKMITGDHAATASAIGRQLGLLDHDVVTTGENLDGLSQEVLRQVVQRTAVFARTSPEHKLRIVEALQSDGAVVAMTGDGVNDAPALKRADVGIAMGQKGTEAAKEAAEMVLADDNFASIVAAVREGRTVYDNLKKVIGWTLPTNGGQAFTIVAAILFGITLPVTPVQILWINMVTAVALGLTLAFEPTEPDTMRRPPRAANEPMLSPFLIWRIVLVSILFVIGAFGMFFWAVERGLAVEEARTIVVNTLVVMQIFYLFSVRFLYATSISVTGVLGTGAVLLGVASITAAQFAFTYLPIMQRLFGTRSIAFLDGISIVAVGVLLLLILELEKIVRRSFRRLSKEPAGGARPLSAGDHRSARS